MRFKINIQINQISNKNMQTKMSIQTNKEESEHEHTNKSSISSISNTSIQSTKVGVHTSNQANFINGTTRYK